MSAIELLVDGRSVAAVSGQTVGAALQAAGIVAWRRTRFADRPRGLFCGIGSCFDCLVSIDGRLPVRACLALVRDRMEISTTGPPSVLDPGRTQQVSDG